MGEKPITMVVRRLIISLFMLSALAGCVGEDTSSVSPNQNPTVNPDFSSLGLNIKSPSTGTTVLDDVVVSGRCSNANYPIKLTGPALGKTIYSVCQSDFTWAAAFKAENISTGSFTINAQIFEPGYAVSSSPISVSLSKGNQVCTSSNASELFANYKSGGDGSSTPYIICNSEQFSNIRFFPSANFVLGQDIDFANRVIAPIAVPFTGELDGQGFQLSNIVVKDLAGNGVSVGLFKYAHGASLLNLNIKNALVEGYQRVGILAGDWRGAGTIQNVKVQGKVSGVGYIGGLIGLGNTSSALSFDNLTTEVEVTGNNYVGGIISFIVTNDGLFNLNNSYILSKVSGIDYVGGVIGRSGESNVTIQNTDRIGSIDALGKWTGGLIGETPGATILNVKNVGNITSSKSAEDVFVGGLVGESRNLLTVTGSESIAGISAGGHYVGGVVGKTHSLNISNSKTRGTIDVLDTKYDSVTRFVGGIVGGIGLDSSIDSTRSYVTMNVKAQYVGGLVGVMNGLASTISNSYYKGSISAYTSHIGGIAGIFAGNSLTNSFSQSQINVNNPTPNAYIGGVAGQVTNPNGVYQRLYNKGNIDIINGIADYVGGIFGYANGQSISEAQFTGDINGARSKIGGIAGYTLSDISKSYSVANINANFRYAGLIAGLVQEANISDVFGYGTLQGKGEVGGLVGWFNSATSSLSRGYFIGNISKLADSIFDDSTFGNIVGLASTGPVSDVFRADSNSLVNDTLAPLASNSIGESLTSSQLRNTVYYTNFTFGAGGWSDPATAYQLPFMSTDYLYAKFAWMMEANQGFQLPEIFSVDPLQTVYPSIFIQDTDVMSELDQNHLAIVDSSDPVSNVTVGQLSITVEAPATNSEIVSGRKLIYGECGIAGNRVVIGGAFNISSVCQDNNRWAAVIDVTGMSLGTINFSVSMKSGDETQTSNVVNKSVIKSDSLCEQEDAIKGTFANTYLGADGQDTPYKICHAGHFANIAFYPGSNFELAKDIDFGGSVINPIQSVFTGSIDGKNYSIKNYSVNKSTAVGAGLFKLVKDATIKNLNIENGFVKGYERVGLLAGSWSGTGSLTNVSIKGSVEGILYTGGVIGLSNSNVDLFMNQVETQINVKGNGYTGGVLGHISTLGGKLVASNVTMNNTVEGLNFVGGFIGSSLESDVTLYNVSQTGNVTGVKENIGGIAGHLRGGTHTNLSVVGNVTSTYHAEEANVGGIVGLVELTTFNLNTASYNGTITAGGDNVGGVVGKLVQGTMTNLQSQGSLNLLDQKYGSVRSYVGGLVGHIIEDSSLTSSFSSMGIDVKAQYAGGLVGRFHGENSVMTDSFFTGSLTGSTSFIGGVAGFFFGEIFRDNYSTGDITVNDPTPNAYVGGIMGYANSWTSNYERIYSTGNITIANGLADYVGGLIGYFRGGSLINCYATGNVSGARSSVGGLVGLHRGTTRFCYSTGTVEGSFRNVGGLVGYQLNGSITDSFSLSNVTAKAVAGGVLGFANASAVVLNNVHSFGVVTRASGSTEDLTTFGPILGSQLNSGAVGSAVVYATENYQAGHNTNGNSISLANANQAGTYSGYDFVSEGAWRMPDAGFTLPGVAGEYQYPIHAWLGSGSTVQSFSIGGSVAGLNYGQIIVTLNESESISVNAGDSAFTFLGKLSAGSEYTVTAQAASGYTEIDCTLNNSNGFVGTVDITSVELVCPTLDSIAVTPDTQSLGAGETLQLSAIGAFSSGVTKDLSSEVSWSSTNESAATVSATGVVSAVANGSAIIGVQFLGMSDSSSISVFQSIAEATSLAWVETSPHNSVNITASWTPSVSGNVSEQQITYYSNTICSGGGLSTKSLAVGVSADSYVGAHNQNYSFRIRTISLDNLHKDSACSPVMNIILDAPNGVSNVASASAWINGSFPVSSPAITWTNPSGVIVSDIKIGLGSSFDSDDLVNFASIGVNSSHTFASLSGLSECSPVFPVVKVVDNYGLESAVSTDTVGFRYDNTAPDQISAVNITGDATETSSPDLSWNAPVDNCALRFYEVALGTTAGGSDVSGGFKPIENATSYKVISGLNGFNISLSSGVDYYASIRSVDYAGNRSLAASSGAWQVQDISASLPDMVAHLDSSSTASILDGSGNDADSVNFENEVDQLNDVSGSTNSHNFRAPSSEARPYFTSGNMFFNGASHSMTATSHADLDLSTQQAKSISVAFRTENNIDSTQVIYEEGDTSRGLNIFISGGSVYCGFWNTSNDGDGAQSFISVSSAILKNKSYRVTWNFDYNNYTGRNGPDGALSCYVNGASVGSIATTSRIHAHGGSIGLGAKIGGSYYASGSSSGDGDNFRGDIFELLVSNQSLDLATIESVHTYLAGKWSQDDLSRPNNLALVNNAALDKSGTASWQPIDPALFTTASYEIAIGQTPGGTEDLYWTDIGNVLSYQAVNGVDGVSLNLSLGVDYYFSVRAVDSIGNKSQVAISEPWSIFDFNNDITNIVVELSSSDTTSILDRNGNNPGQGGFRDEVEQWLDTSGQGNDFYSPINNRPTYDGVNLEVSFNGNTNVLIMDDSSDINTQIMTEKSVSIVFGTGIDVTARQVIYEEGDEVRGLNIYIDSGKLYCGFWNTTDDGDGAQSFIGMSKAITASSYNVVTWTLDYSNYTGAGGDDGSFDCHLNGVVIGSANTTSRIHPHIGATAMGAMDNGTYFHDGVDAGAKGFNFGGVINEVIINNQAIREDTAQGFHSYLLP